MENILQIDFEDWYYCLDFTQWNNYEDRINYQSEKLLSILNEFNAKATFFVVGHLAEKYPSLVKEIIKNDHEIGTHGYMHKELTKQTPEEFKSDLLKSIRILEDITGDKIWGFRACKFTLVKKTSWAVKILKEAGLKYDSSIFPFKTHQYGVPDAPRYPYTISSDNILSAKSDDDFLEFPLSVYKLPVIGMNLPVAGGLYLRALPFSFINHALNKINKQGYPAVCYLHPWELDPDHPREKQYPFYHYYNLKNTEKKFRKLLTNFKFISTKTWMLKYL